MHTTYRRKICVSIFMVLLSFSLVLCAVLKTAGSDPAQDSGNSFSFDTLQTSQPQRRTQLSVETDRKELLASAHVADQPMFLIRLVGNELRVFPYGQEQEYTVVPSADPRTFRESDRLRLIDGIEIDSAEELAQLIEDFSS